MKALVYRGPNTKAVEDRPKPEIQAPGDAIIKIVKTTICGTDLHILKGDVATCTPGRILGHEGVGIVDTVGPGVTAFRPGDRVLISCISACGKCDYCRRGMYSHCTTGGWILGNEIEAPGDAIIKILKTTICGTDLHILKGDVATCTPGRILGHEGVGIVDTVGPGVTAFRPGDRVLISCISACGKCDYCRRGMYSHCTTGGWILGNEIDGTQAEYVRTPYADTSLYPIPEGADEEALVMLSDILPTGFECGVLNGKVAPGSTVAIVGAGPIGLAALLTAQFYSPAEIIMIDLDDNRLQIAQQFGATQTINSADGNAAATIKKLTSGRGVDTAIEAVGVPATFALCQEIVGPGGIVANVGVHGRPVELHLERLWSQNISITTRLVDTVTTPMLLKTVQSKKLDPTRLITHHFGFDHILEAYDTFARAAETKALKVIISA